MTRPLESLRRPAIVLVSILGLSAFAAATPISDLQQAVRDRDVPAFLVALGDLLASGDRRAVRSGIDAYVALAESLMERAETWPDFQQLHGKAASAFAKSTDKESIREFERIRRSSRGDWLARVLVLDVAAFNSGLDLETACLEALDDKAPQVVRRSLHYLRNTKKIPIVERIVARFVELEDRYGKKDDREWSRTLLAFQSSLMQLLHVDLPAAIDWRNYVESRKARDDFFTPKEASGRGRTEVTLFGAAVTGKNIVFVLDISGSMLTTDPLPRGSSTTGRGRTVVGDPAEPEGPPAPPEERRRITRAKKELVRVVESLPRDVRFNLIAYSSDVKPWRKTLVAAAAKQREEASAWINGLEADGITVTDLALEDAFSDLDVDTIYLVTDGAPTHIGTSGPGLPEDSLALIRGIHERVDQLNFLREVRIFSLGFRGAKEDFLQRLSRDNGGRYVAIE